MAPTILPSTRVHHLPLVDPARVDSPWVHPPSGVRFVRRWERLHALDCHRYDDAGDNISVRYSARGVVVSVFVFPLEAGPHERVVDAAFTRSVKDMALSLVGPRGIEASDVGFARPGATPLWGRRVRALGVEDARGSSSVEIVEMFAHERWALKFRVTSVPRELALAERFLDAWLHASAFALRASEARGEVRAE